MFGPITDSVLCTVGVLKTVATLWRCIWSREVGGHKDRGGPAAVSEADWINGTWVTRVGLFAPRG